MTLQKRKKNPFNAHFFLKEMRKNIYNTEVHLDVITSLLNTGVEMNKLGNFYKALEIFEQVRGSDVNYELFFEIIVKA